MDSKTNTVEEGQEQWKEYTYYIKSVALAKHLMSDKSKPLKDRLYQFGVRVHVLVDDSLVDDYGLPFAQVSVVVGSTATRVDCAVKMLEKMDERMLEQENNELEEFCQAEVRKLFE